VINSIFGVLTAWALVRYEFPGKTIINALVDLPFALPTAVAGIALATLYSPNGWVGQFLTPLGIKAAYNPVGVTIALIFIGLPFVVRTIEPVLRDAAEDVEEAAASLGANRIDTILRIVLPALAPAWLTGFAMAFARGVGEYGSVIFIAGNMPYKSEIAPLLIIIQLEQFEYARAATIAVVMLAVSFTMLLVINAIQAWARRFD
jgi:sulfate transport system permease protein